MSITEHFSNVFQVAQSKSAKNRSGQNLHLVKNRPLSLEGCIEVFRYLDRIADCCALQTHSEIEAASRIVGWLGLPSHHDPNKNWDTLKSLFYILRVADQSMPILDAGSGAGSVILKWLSLLGFRRLHACDIRPVDSGRFTNININFTCQDLVRTNYKDSFFKAVTSISVIEHGVDLDAFVKEMSRIISPKGLLLISSDYWSEPIDCTGIYPYGPEFPEMKVFQKQEMEEFCHVAETEGFRLIGELDLNTTEKACYWERVDRAYTFAFMAFERQEGI